MCIPNATANRITTLPVQVENQQNQQPRVSPKVDRLGRDVIELIKGAIQQAQKAKGKDLIALIGNTGTGKSTAVNQLMGKKMEYVRRKIQVAAGEEEIAKIGHRTATSETRYAHVYEQEGCQFVFADCGGFYDTRGISTDIAVITSLKLTLENSNSVKLVLCFDSGVITADRGIHFAQSVNLALGTLLKDYKKNANSILLMFTKPTPGPDGKMFNVETAKEILMELSEDLLDGPQKKIYEFLLRDNGKYIAVCDPLSNASRDENTRILRGMGCIENPKNAFQTAYSAHSQLKILEEMTAIAVSGSDLFTQYFSNQGTIARYNAEIVQLKEKIGNIVGSIQALGNGQNDPAAIQKAENAIIEENKMIVRQQEEQIRQLKNQIAENNIKIEAIREKIALLDKRGEEEVDYWTDQIDQEGINIESKTVTVTTHEKSGLFNSSSHSDTSTTSAFDKRAIPRDFNYRGPEILRVVKDPESGSCWSNENKGLDFYTIHYESGKGERALASVKIFVKRKHLPTEVNIRSSYDQNIVHEIVATNKLLQDIGDIEKIIHNAQIAISAKGNTLEKLEIFTKTVKELETSLAEYTQKLNAKFAESSELQNVIRDAQEDYLFLKNYLELSNDSNLKAIDIVTKFLTQHQDYSRLSS